MVLCLRQHGFQEFPPSAELAFYGSLASVQSSRDFVDGVFLVIKQMNHNPVLSGKSVPHVLLQIGLQIAVVFEADSGNGFAVQNGGIGFLVNLILFLVTDE